MDSYCPNMCHSKDKPTRLYPSKLAAVFLCFYGILRATNSKTQFKELSQMKTDNRDSSGNLSEITVVTRIALHSLEIHPVQFLSRFACSHLILIMASAVCTSVVSCFFPFMFSSLCGLNLTGCTYFTVRFFLSGQQLIKLLKKAAVNCQVLACSWKVVFGRGSPQTRGKKWGLEGAIQGIHIRFKEAKELRAGLQLLPFVAHKSPSWQQATLSMWRVLELYNKWSLAN